MVWINPAENPFLICFRSEELPVDLGQLHAPSVEGCNNAFPAKATGIISNEQKMIHLALTPRIMTDYQLGIRDVLVPLPFLET